jgi:hypothetical protein
MKQTRTADLFAQQDLRELTEEHLKSITGGQTWERSYRPPVRNTSQGPLHRVVGTNMKVYWVPDGVAVPV